MNVRRVTRLDWLDRRGVLASPMLLALVTDLHNAAFDNVLPALQGADAILVAGDLVNRHRRSHRQASLFLQQAPDIAPTYLSVGNHERRYVHGDAFLDEVRRSRVRLLDGEVERIRPDVVLGGFSSCTERGTDSAVVARLAACEGLRLLLCHHPEYYEPWVRGHGIDLCLSGHAHGGQIQLWGHGLYAPGQGLFPKLTHGFHDGDHLLVSRGMTNTGIVPRIGNPCELILLQLRPGGKDGETA